MHHTKLLRCLPAFAILFACNLQPPGKTPPVSNRLTGTWRLIKYEDFDSINRRWIQPYGAHPRGYFTYTKSGIVNLNISAEDPLKVSEDSVYLKPFTLGVLLDNAAGYFGHYIVDEKAGVVTHQPTGGSVLWYVGTNQQRQFIIRNDTLFLGDPNFSIGRRVLVREE